MKKGLDVVKKLEKIAQEIRDLRNDQTQVVYHQGEPCACHIFDAILDTIDKGIIAFPSQGKGGAQMKPAGIRSLVKHLLKAENRLLKELKKLPNGQHEDPCDCPGDGRGGNGMVVLAVVPAGEVHYEATRFCLACGGRLPEQADY